MSARYFYMNFYEWEDDVICFWFIKFIPITPRDQAELDNYMYTNVSSGRLSKRPVKIADLSRNVYQ